MLSDKVCSKTCPSDVTCFSIWKESNVKWFLKVGLLKVWGKWDWPGRDEFNNRFALILVTTSYVLVDKYKSSLMCFNAYIQTNRWWPWLQKWNLIFHTTSSRRTGINFSFDLIKMASTMLHAQAITNYHYPNDLHSIALSRYSAFKF